MLAVYGKSPDVQQRATVILRERPAEDFLDLLVGMMIDPLKYEVKPVGGPGSPGVLFVEGETVQREPVLRARRRRTSSWARATSSAYDQFGMPVITRPIGGSPIGSTVPAVPGSKTLVKQSKRTPLAMSRSPRARSWQRPRGVPSCAEAQLEEDVSEDQVDQRGPQRASTIGSWPSRRPPRARTTAAHPRSGATPSPRATIPGQEPTENREKPTLTELVPLAYNPSSCRSAS